MGSMFAKTSEFNQDISR
ncbi:hypothetical protein JIY74_30170 [Vibrio harveyi]|nr:hypothetical protein [Vibrio harveyi]